MAIAYFNNNGTAEPINAPKLDKKVKINGVDFDGSIDITIPIKDSDADNLVSIGSSAPSNSRTKIWIDDTSRLLQFKTSSGLGFNKIYAEKLAIPRTINGVPFDGSANIVIPTSNAGVSSVNGNTGDITLNKTWVGLGNADNTSDLNKPISSATQTALNLKQNAATAVTSVNSVLPINGNVTLTKSSIGLGNVDNTSDATKVVASAGKLTTPAKINGVAFDGSKDINIFPKRTIDVKVDATVITYGYLTDSTSTTLSCSSASFSSSNIGQVVIISSGKGVGNARVITGVPNSTTISIDNPFEIQPVAGDDFKVVDGVSLNVSDLNATYNIDVTTGDVVFILPAYSSELRGTPVEFQITKTTHTKSVYIVSRGTSKFIPYYTGSVKIFTKFTKISVIYMTEGLFTDVYSPLASNDWVWWYENYIYVTSRYMIYKFNESGNGTVTLTTNNDFKSCITGKMFTVELHATLLTPTNLNFPSNVTFTATPTFVAGKTNVIVLRTMDACATWVANLAYTY